jgi:hypothetical protein
VQAELGARLTALREREMAVEDEARRLAVEREAVERETGERRAAAERAEEAARCVAEEAATARSQAEAAAREAAGQVGVVLRRCAILGTSLIDWHALRYDQEAHNRSCVFVFSLHCQISNDSLCLVAKYNVAFVLLFRFNFSFFEQLVETLR